MIIRKCLTKDVLEVIKIERLSFNEPYNPLVFFVYHQISPDGFFVAEEGGLVVGYSIGTITDEYKGLVVSLAVKPRFRMRGIGTALLNSVLDYLENFVDEIEIQVGASNCEALAFYKNFGFTKKEYVNEYYANGEDAVIMTSDIRSKIIKSKQQ